MLATYHAKLYERLAKMLHVAALAALILPGMATAAYPEKPVTIVVPFAAGGGSDIVARLIAQQLGEAYGQPFIVENKPGASTQIATRHVINATPDGHTLLLATTSVINNATLYKNLDYDASVSLRPVVPLVDVPAFLAVGTALDVNTVPEFLQQARALSAQNRLNFGSAGTASTLHLAAQWFNQQAQLNAIHVPYRGSSANVVALASGEVAYAFDNLGPALPQITNKRLRFLAIAGPQRFPTLPDIAPLKNFGFPDTDMASWFILMAPAATPDTVVDALNTSVNRILARADIQQRLLNLGLLPTGGSSAQLEERMRADTLKWADIIRLGNVTIQQ